MKKTLLTLVVLLSGVVLVFSQNNVGIGTPTPDASSILELNSNTKGFLVPRMTTAERTSIASPATGLLVFDVTIGCYFYYNSGWNSLCQLSGPTGATGAQGATGATGATGPGTICAAAATGYINMFTSPADICNSAIFQSGSNVGLHTTTPVVSFQINSTDALGLPSGTTAQQPASAPTGSIRYNTTLGITEVFTGSCWQNINTPPIGATYVQWFNAANPNTIYPCTQWVSSDITNGEFIRAWGGASNVANGSALTGGLQNSAVQAHTHSVTGVAAGSGILTTSSGGNHSHNWGGNWSNDDSRQYTSDNGDGTGNTISDGYFWWGGSSGTTANYTNRSSSGANVFYSNVYIPYDDNLSSDTKNLSMNDNPVQCGSSWDGRHTVGNFMGRLSDNCMGHNHTVEFYAHRHWIKARATTLDGAHTHTLADHTHTLTLTGGSMNTGNSDTETRPDNVAVIFWRRTN